MRISRTRPGDRSTGAEQAWFIELRDDPYPDIPPDPEFVEGGTHPEQEPPKPESFAPRQPELFHVADELGRNPLKWDEW